MEIRFASGEADFEAVYRLRHDVYLEDVGAPIVATGERRLTDESDVSARQILAEEDGRVVGCLRLQWGADAPFDAGTRHAFDLERFTAIVPEAKMGVLTRFAIVRELRGSLVSFGLLAKACEFILEHDLDLAFCDCKPHLVHHYLKLGFRPFTSCHAQSIAGLVVPLVSVVGDVAFMERVGSPLLGLFEGRNFDSRLVARLSSVLPEEPTVRVLSNLEEASRWAEEYGRWSAAEAEAAGVLAGIEGAALARLIERGQVLTCRRGDSVIHEGMADRTVFVILGGTAEIGVGGRTVDIANRGEAVGEMAFLTGTPRQADVVAAGDELRVLALNERSVRGLQQADPSTAATFFHNLARGLCEKLATARARRWRGIGQAVVATSAATTGREHWRRICRTAFRPRRSP